MLNISKQKFTKFSLFYKFKQIKLSDIKTNSKRYLPENFFTGMSAAFRLFFLFLGLSFIEHGLLLFSESANSISRFVIIILSNIKLVGRGGDCEQYFAFWSICNIKHCVSKKLFES